MSSYNSNSLFASHQSLLEADYGKPAEQRVLKRNVVVFLLLDTDGAPTKDCMENLCVAVEDPDGGLQ